MTTKATLMQIGQEIASGLLKGRDSAAKPDGVPVIQLSSVCSEHGVSEILPSELTSVKEAMDETLDKAARLIHEQEG